MTPCVFFQLVAVFQEVQPERMDSPRETMSNGFSSAAPSPEPMHYYPHLEYQDPARGEIEVNEASLKASMSDLLLLFTSACVFFLLLLVLQLHFKDRCSDVRKDSVRKSKNT